MNRDNQKQLKFENFYLPFGGRLRSDNRWVRFAKLIPWHEFEDLYAASFAGWPRYFWIEPEQSISALSL